MPIIAPHHRPGHPLYDLRPNNVYTPTCAWPEDCTVQWGSKGIVLSRSPDTPSYCTAFFEAFPRDPDTFVRGEGATIQEAEAAAFAKFQRYQACPGHEFERRNYRNGAGFCKHCGLFSSGVFEPLTRCEVCDTPTTWSYGTDAQGQEHWFCQEHDAQRKVLGFRSPVDALEDDLS